MCPSQAAFQQLQPGTARIHSSCCRSSAYQQQVNWPATPSRGSWQAAAMGCTRHQHTGVLQQLTFVLESPLFLWQCL